MAGKCNGRCMTKHHRSLRVDGNVRFVERTSYPKIFVLRLFVQGQGWIVACVHQSPSVKRDVKRKRVQPIVVLFDGGVHRRFIQLLCVIRVRLFVGKHG